MKKIMMLNPAIATSNRGDDIIMKCVRDELNYITQDNFVYELPTHLSPFHSYQIWRNSLTVQNYSMCDYKFVCGSNLLVQNLLTHYPQWNINLFNYAPIRGCILVAIGAGAGKKANNYTKHIYKKLLNKDYYHSVRDERSKDFVESLGFKAINTGCITMWMFTPEFCSDIPKSKADKVIFTLTARNEPDARDQLFIDILIRNYSQVYFWVQGHDDLDYLQRFDHIDSIKIVSPEVDAFESLLLCGNIDYVGTRLHGGIYAMRKKIRSIIIVIDERAREISLSNHLISIEKDETNELEKLINSNFETKIIMPFPEINKWKSQFRG